MNATPFTPSFVGATGQYPIFEYIDSSINSNYLYSANSSNSNYLYSSNSSNSNYLYSSNIKSEIDILKQKDLSHDGSISSINTTIGQIQTTVGGLGTLTTGHTTQITALETLTTGHTASIATNTASIATTNIVVATKLNKSSLTGVSVIYKDAAENVQLSYNGTHFKEVSLATGNTRLFCLNDVYENLPTTMNTSIFNSSNDCFNHSVIYTNSALANYYTKTDNNNILSSTSNTLANYNNLYNKPDIYTKTETLNNFYTKSQINSSINTNKIQVGTNNYGYTDTIVELDRNFFIRKNAPLAIGGTGDLVQLTAGTGLNKSTLFMSESGDASLFSYVGVAEVRANNNNAKIYGSNVEITATNDIYLYGNVKANGKLAKKSPIYFTTNRTFTMNSITYSAYDIDLDLYTKKELLDGFYHRHFRVRLFFSNGRLDFQFTPTTYQVYMTSYNSLSIKAYSSLYGESQLDQPDGIGYFLYRNSIDKLTFCANTTLFGNSVKVYNVFEDML